MHSPVGFEGDRLKKLQQGATVTVGCGGDGALPTVASTASALPLPLSFLSRRHGVATTGCGGFFFFCNFFHGYC
uniref:Uncharacterized protein n=1 Tax=Oryza sativa subsp. japonica TaxID=39947 RepID=Q6ZA13_ORYSJ|nr:hypothetical protein [Oryza sativa Japonica Group]